MSDERLMQKLAEAVRRKANDQPAWLDDRWERLAAGSLPPEERAELAALAQRSDDARRLWERCQPLEPEVHAGIVGRIVRSASEVSASPAPKGEGQPRRGTWWWAPAVVAAASLAAVMLLWPGRTVAPLPAYEARLEGGVRAQRSEGAPPGVPVFESGTRFELTLRPRTRVEGRLTVHAFLESGPHFEPWLARDAPPDKGAVTIDGVVGEDIELRPGEWKLWMVVARPGAMPETDALRAHLTRGLTAGQGWVAAAPLELQMRP